MLDNKPEIWYSIDRKREVNEMRKIKCNLTKEQFDKMSKMNHHTLYEFCNNSVTTPFNLSIIWGYGLYGVDEPKEENGNYTVEIEIGETCD